MIIMDLKGISWVGHVYQKFEAMCLEVEDIMYQDTVKYVENQVQTVGSSVKKFYSDVMQDVIPPSSMDLVKGTVALNLPAEQTSDVGICKMTRVGMKEEAIKVDNEQLTEYLRPTSGVDEDACHGSSFHGFHIEDSSFQSDSGDSVRGACSDVYAKECNKRSGHNESSLGAPKISKKENLPRSEMSGAITHMEKDLSRASSSCELLDENQQASSDQVAVNPIPVTIEMADSKCIDELENASKGTPGDFTNCSSSKNCNESETSRAHSSCRCLLAELNDIGTNNGMVSLVGSSVYEDVQPSKLSDKITSVCHPGRSDCSTMDAIEGDIVVERGFETIQQVDNTAVEETCVLVNGDELHFVPLKEGKHKPYKKKIQDAICSRMRSRRRHEYEQLAVWYGEDEKSKQEYAAMKRSPSHGSCEFEWELL